MNSVAVSFNADGSAGPRSLTSAVLERLRADILSTKLVPGQKLHIAGLAKQFSVSLAAVVAMPDPLYREIGCAFLLRKPGCGLEVASLDAWCRARLANYKIPKRFIIRDELPLLPIGKLDKAALRAEALRLGGESTPLSPIPSPPEGDA